MGAPAERIDGPMGEREAWESMKMKRRTVDRVETGTKVPRMAKKGMTRILFLSSLLVIAG